MHEAASRKFNVLKNHSRVRSRGHSRGAKRGGPSRLGTGLCDLLTCLCPSPGLCLALGRRRGPGGDRGRGLGRGPALGRRHDPGVGRGRSNGTSVAISYRWALPLPLLCSLWRLPVKIIMVSLDIL